MRKRKRKEGGGGGKVEFYSFQVSWDPTAFMFLDIEASHSVNRRVLTVVRGDDCTSTIKCFICSTNKLEELSDTLIN